ncbi:RiPP maturation radical SAM C-methyltransferase [Mesorhizobium helmanticense]|uniref:B12-binding domain-containing protein n=1 Tax=Mesorhizobium helmanticense TaxID=1776423 RepID=A0A2T4IQ39_9HYPH|nr:RiPP maturation radical SAM C-methyltransferase [Mesorhizobium helmanticense]PTE07757.1 hypothetical protein C9427_24105 [Mesorhizobium helmanticense]
MFVARSPRVALAALPWADMSEPSLGLSILKGQLARDGIEARVFHLYLDMLRTMTAETYRFFSEEWGLNEFLFTGVLQETLSDDQYDELLRLSEGLSQRHSRYREPLEVAEAALRIREKIVPDFLNYSLRKILAINPTMVGLTCMFDQTVASIALARLIKTARPEVLVVLGGYALEGPPGDVVLRAFPWIDAVVRGDGEPVVAALARASVTHGDERPKIAGVTWSCANGNRVSLPADIGIIEESPDPVYDDWFADVTELRAEAEVEVRTKLLPVEASRGCWWGQKHHCVFCGIDEKALKYRMKSRAAVVDMLGRMHARYGAMKYRFSDYIMSRELVAALPELAEHTPRFELSSEIKANQTPARMEAMARAGFVELQPGIESFSSRILRLMDKGVTSAANVTTIKNGCLRRVIIHYNLLFNIPGETVEDYANVLQMIPRIYHLIPPVSRSEAFVTRFAPLHSNPKRFGYDGEIVHHDCYKILFSGEYKKENGINLNDYAYYFRSYVHPPEELAQAHSLLVRQVNHWKRQFRERHVWLDYEERGGTIYVSDTRFSADETLVALDGWQRAVFLAFASQPRSAGNVAQELGCSERDIADLVDEMEPYRLFWRDEDLILNVALPKQESRANLAARWHEGWPSIWC